jgi:iron complex outermembrane receptor protein
VEGLFAAAQKNVDTDLNEEETPGYGILNLHLGVRRGGLSLTVGIGNLFDRAYMEHLSYQRDPFRSGVRVPEPGRNVFANIAFRK